MKKEKIEFGSKIIEFDLVFKDRKSLGIRVTPDQNVLVQAPIGAGTDEIKRKIKKRAPWILKQQSYFISFHPLTPPRKYINGETQLYSGRQYRLKIIESRHNQVKLKGGFLEVFTNRKDYPIQIKKLVNEWYKIHAEKKLAEYAAPLIERFAKYHIQPKSIQIRKMSKRWGSCSADGKIILNTELIKAPRGCIEYVILHELCHLAHPNHSKAFFDLQFKEMPDWEKWKERLERFLA